MIGLMVKILIIEPHPEVRDLLVRIVARLGLEPVTYRGAGAHDLAEIGVVLVEPAALNGIEVARLARQKAGAATVCVSIYPPSDETRALDPVAYLVKPFSLVELERALLAALDSRLPVAAA